MHSRGQTTTIQTRLEIGEHAATVLRNTKIITAACCSVGTESYPGLETTNPALPDYQLALRRIFLLPTRIMAPC